VSQGKYSLLIVDDEPSILPTLAALLGRDFEVLTANSADAAQAILEKNRVDLILTDQRMPRRTGIELLEWVRAHCPGTVRLLMTGFGELDDAVEAINRGHVYYFLLKPWRTEELLQVLRNAAEKVRLERSQEQLLSALRRLNSELEARVTERTGELERANRLLQQRTGELEEANQLLQQRTRELERLVLIDPLTGLFNRRAMDSLAQAELKRHTRYRNPLALGIVDVDFFKQVNTDFDLTGGDQVLMSLGRTLTASLREVDSVGRVGGEEFLIIARETDEAGAHSLAERIRGTVEQTPIEFKGQHIHITVSLGFAVVDSETSADYSSLYDRAANALTLAKKLGRNRFVVRPFDDPSRAVASG
jgi:diguanylate cyclase (GGDEF)-like protein